MLNICVCCRHCLLNQVFVCVTVLASSCLPSCPPKLRWSVAGFSLLTRCETTSRPSLSYPFFFLPRISYWCLISCITQLLFKVLEFLNNYNLFLQGSFCALGCNAQVETLNLSTFARQFHELCWREPMASTSSDRERMKIQIALPPLRNCSQLMDVGF